MGNSCGWGEIYEPFGNLLAYGNVDFVSFFPSICCAFSQSLNADDVWREICSASYAIAKDWKPLQMSSTP